MMLMKEQIESILFRKCDHHQSEEFYSNGKDMDMVYNYTYGSLETELNTVIEVETEAKWQQHDIVTTSYNAGHKQTYHSNV